MSLFSGTLFRLTLFLAVALCRLPALRAAETNSTALPAAATNGLALGAIPKLRSPVDTFRQLLALNTAERKQFLTNHPPEAQRAILAKLREYQLLKPDERELRLKAAELQWYLQPLMRLPRAERQARLALIPEAERTLVEERLGQWDMLPSELQEQLLDDEMTSRYFTQSQTNANWPEIVARMSPERRAKLEAGLDRWRKLSDEERQRTVSSFNAFFELSPEEKETALSTLSEAEQRQMDKTLQAYAKLPVAQRQKCIQSFQKFAGLSLAERQLFLKKAEHWKLMSPAERETWRKLVNLAPLQPPLPSETHRLPSGPPRAAPSVIRPAIATNL